MIRVPNQAGSLARMITPFEKCGVNLTWIESFPVPGTGNPGKGGETNPSYLFFVDVEGHQSDKIVTQAIELVRSAANTSISSAPTRAVTASKADAEVGQCRDSLSETVSLEPPTPRGAGTLISQPFHSSPCATRAIEVPRGFAAAR